MRPRSAQPRIAFYSHDTLGLGHMRRNLLLAEHVAQAGAGASVLVIAGSIEAPMLGTRKGVDCVTLPALAKRATGSYVARSLGLALADLVAVRSSIIRAALDAFAPDLFVVDNVPRGAEQELNATLASLRRGGRTRVVLGLRDVLDAPDAVRAEWRRARNDDAIRRYYDAIWVYGDRGVYDLPEAYGFPPHLTAKLHYTGYLDPRGRLMSAPESEHRAARGLEPYVLCLVGGGQDGAHLARTFAESSVPPGMRRVILTGPHMHAADRRMLAAAAAADPTLRVLEFLAEPVPLVARATCVVAMGGYNTICEIVSLRKRAVIVPRTTPRCEQRIRAERLQQRGLVDCLLPADLSPGRLTARIAHALEQPPPEPVVDVSGLDRVTTLIQGLLEPSDVPAPAAVPALTRDAAW